ncbi:MAG: transglutaminase-like domain-containing protein [Desulfurococcus sp.]|jgi:hypothetical protein|uniref:transglutaminase-like domain-containing protein n=1 Tax=Desulfurococcus sp. TaxID=51678 RepID=UPI00316942C2
MRVLRVFYVALVVVLLCLQYTAPPIVHGEITPRETCSTLYFINAIKVYNSLINDTLLLETPQNTTLNTGLRQESTPIYVYNLGFNETLGSYVFNVSAGNGFFGFFISRITVCYSDNSTILGYYRLALNNPGYRISDESIPGDIVTEYVKTPYSRVVEVVVPAFEDWFKNRYNSSVYSASKLGIAVNAAYFIYTEYFTYNASSLPRTIDEVIESRQGDCDDMSRVLVELLSYYNIPAVIGYGYVYIPDLRLETNLGNVTYYYAYNGPHAFVLAYIPGLGWVSLDFLAGSLLEYPFVFEGYTRGTIVNESEVQEVVDFHKKISATQVFIVVDEEKYKSMFGESISGLPSKIEKYIEEVSGGPGETTEPSSTTTTRSEVPASTTTVSRNSGPGITGPGSTLIAIMLLAALVVAAGIILLVRRSTTSSSFSSPSLLFQPHIP